MGRNDIGRLIEGLEASFEVARSQEDDFVADDLAHALRQGRHLAEILSTKPWRVSTGGMSADIELVAADYVMVCSGRLLIPLHRGVFTPSRGRVPQRSSATMRRALNRVARLGGSVEADSGNRVTAGRVSAVGADYLDLDTPTGRVLVPLDGIRSIRLSREGSADAS